MLIFSYGSLYDPEVQKKEFGTTFKVQEDLDYIQGYSISDIVIDGKKYTIIEPAPDSSILSGAIIEIPDEYINQIDSFEGTCYNRIAIKTMTGLDCQVYVKATKKIEYKMTFIADEIYYENVSGFLYREAKDRLYYNVLLDSNIYFEYKDILKLLYEKKV